MNEAKMLTLDRFSTRNIIFFTSSLGMLISSIYLLIFHFEFHFPSGIDSLAICESSGFFSCSAAATSPISTFFDIPISSLGLILGIFFTYSSLFPTINLEKTNSFLSKLNFAGCIILFSYSLIYLKSLCPLCSLFYLFSTVAFILNFRFVGNQKPSLKILGIYSIIGALALASLFTVIKKKGEEQLAATSPLIKDFLSSPNLGNPDIESPFRLYSSTKKFSDAPIQLSIFSDFQCHFCQVLAKRTEKLIQRFQGKINIQFFFYPLDNNCNPNVNQPMHQLACKASYLASCLPKTFLKVHDDIFENMEHLSNSWLNKYAKKHEIVKCMNSKTTEETVVKMIDTATIFNISSTPTLIINGRKVEGALPLSAFYAIFNKLLAEQKEVEGK